MLTTSPLQDPRVAPYLNILTTQQVTDQNGNQTNTHIRIAAKGYNNPDETPMQEDEQITPEWLEACADQIRRRCDKNKDQQKKRTKAHAEVFTPLPTVKKMVDASEEAFTIDPDQPEWEQRVNARTIEIACGEAPFITSRYEPTTGEPVDEPDRVGMLDRKLRLIAEHAPSLSPIQKTISLYIAIQQTYGCEYQGDNLLIARANVYLTWYEAYQRVTGTEPSPEASRMACEIISTTITQADFLTGLLPTTNDISMIAVYEGTPEPAEWAHPYYDTAQEQAQKKPTRRRRKAPARRTRTKATV